MPMFQVQQYSGDRVKDYNQMLKQLDALIAGEPDTIANLSNASALLNQFLDDVNWVGFYIWKDNELVLGPFQGLPACIRIPYGQGVCGTALKERAVQRFDDVNQFPGHIACDSASRSEIVAPLLINDEPYGVLDIDSPSHNRFDETDEIYITKYAEIVQSLLPSHKQKL